jgi:hypothetical protein
VTDRKKNVFGKCGFDSDERTYGTGSLNANGVSSNTNSTIARIGLEKAGFTITWQTDVGDAWRCGLELERAHESTTTKNTGRLALETVTCTERGAGCVLEVVGHQL